MYQSEKKSRWTGRVDQDDPENAMRWHQVVTHLNLKEELQAVGAQHYAILGYATDLGVALNSGRIGAYRGPDEVRTALGNLPMISEKYLFDAGNISTSESTIEAAQHLLGEKAGKLLGLGYRPILVGGGHDIAFGTFLGASSYINSNKKLGIINLDAHFDLRHAQGHNSGTAFFNAAEYCKANGLEFNYIVLGIQEAANTQALFIRAKELGVNYFLDSELSTTNPDWKNSINRFISQVDFVYLSIDMDVLNVAFAPGVSAINPMGITPWKLREIISFILSENKTLIVDVAELNPDFDRDHQTAKLAARIIQQLILEW